MKKMFLRLLRNFKFKAFKCYDIILIKSFVQIKLDLLMNFTHFCKRIQIYHLSCQKLQSLKF